MQEVENFKYMLNYEERHDSFINIPSNINTSQNLLYKSLKNKFNRKTSLQKNDKIEKKININVVKFKEGKFFLKIQPGEKIIQRTQEDLNWLSDYLRIEFPFYYVF